MYVNGYIPHDRRHNSTREAPIRLSTFNLIFEVYNLAENSFYDYIFYNGTNFHPETTISHFDTYMY